MRNAINNNPIVQIGLLAGLGILVAVVFMSGMGGDPPPPSDDPAATEAVAPAATSAVPVAPTASAPTPAPAVPSAPAGGAPFEAGPGLPERIVTNYEDGRTVVIMVLQDEAFDKEKTKGKRKGAFEDRALLEQANGFKTTVPTYVMGMPASEVGKISRIAEGISLDRVPALIVLSPLEGKLAAGESAPMPTASVSYGYRGRDSIAQAVQDAVYKGKTTDYAP